MGDEERLESGHQSQKQQQQQQPEESETMEERASGWIWKAARDACRPASLERRTPRPRKQRLTTWNRRTLAETTRQLFSVVLTLCAVTETYLLRARYVGERPSVLSGRPHFSQQ